MRLHGEFDVFGGADARVAARLIPDTVRVVAENPDRMIPVAAKDPVMSRAVVEAVKRVPTGHRLWIGDARKLDRVGDESVHLVVTSPPYWTLKRYAAADVGVQLGDVGCWDEFCAALDEVWVECARVLVPGGRVCVNVGDVLVSRREGGRHRVMPLGGRVTVGLLNAGLDPLTPICWQKIGNGSYESGGGGMYGKPYEPNMTIASTREWIVMARKPGYRSPDVTQRVLSFVPEPEFVAWCRDTWDDIPGVTSRTPHPAPFPEQLAVRLIRMFSFVGDTVCDPFAGSGTVAVAAADWGRDSISVDVSARYLDQAAVRLAGRTARLL